MMQLSSASSGGAVPASSLKIQGDPSLPLQPGGLTVLPWELVESEVPQETEIPTRETLFAVGNGFVGIRGYHDDTMDRRAALPVAMQPLNTAASSVEGDITAMMQQQQQSVAHQTMNPLGIPTPTNIFSSGSGPASARGSVRALESTLTQNPVAGPSASNRGTYLNGVYDEALVNQTGTSFCSGCCKRECFMVPVPDAFAVELFVEEERVTPLLKPDRVQNYRRTLDIRSGELKRKYTWQSATGVAIAVTESRFVCTHRKNVAATKYSIAVVPNPKNPASIDIRVHSRCALATPASSMATSSVGEGHMMDSMWEIEASNSLTRVQDVSSTLRVRTKRSRKQVAIATNERCYLINNPACPPPPLENIMFNATSAPSLGTTPPFSPTLSSTTNPTMMMGTSPMAPIGSSVISPTAVSLATTFLSPVSASACQIAPMSPRTVASSQSARGAPSTLLQTLFHGALPCHDPNASMHFVKFCVYVTETDCDVDDMEQRASELTEAAVDTGYDGLLCEHKDAMERFWNAADVVIASPNHTRVQGTMRYNMLQIYMSTGRWKNTVVGPRGLTGEVFSGLMSWDAEIFVIPFFLHSCPSIARSLLQFRVDTLPEAMHRARDFELRRGAIFPSRTINGGENAPSLSCALHLHVNADIAYAIQQYYEATGDVEFLLHGGAEVVWHTALVWLDWGAWEKGTFHIRNVTGPDEYNVLVDDSYYTNLMAQNHMNFAVELLDTLPKLAGGVHVDQLDRMLMSCGVDNADVKAWREAAAKMHLPYDPHYRIHLQDGSFMRKRAWGKLRPFSSTSPTARLSGFAPAAGGTAAGATPVRELGVPITTAAAHVKYCTVSPSASDAQLDQWGGPYSSSGGSNPESPNSPTSMLNSPSKRTSSQFLHTTTSNILSSSLAAGATIESGPLVMIQEFHPVVVFRHRICKTADVVLAAVLLRDRFTRDEKDANFHFYESLTAHDSSLTAPMLSIAAADLQLREKAVNYFKYSLLIDVQNFLKNTSGGLHMSCLAGSWQCITYGFGGFCVLNGVPHFNPWMPDGWEEYRFHIRHRGSTVTVHVSRRFVTYSLADGASKLLIIHAQSARVHLAKGRPVSIKLQRDVRSFDFDAAVFDLDSIIDSVEEDHFEAWRRTLDPLFRAAADVGKAPLSTSPTQDYKPFNNEMYLAYLRHHPISQAKRHQGLQKLLTKRGIDLPVGELNDPPSETTLSGLYNRKLLHFRAIVKERGVHIRAGAVELLNDFRENGVVIGVVSASKNGRWMLQQAPALMACIDNFVDANLGEELHLRWRPELDFFDTCAKRMDTTPSRTVIFVDGIDGFSKTSLRNYWLVVNTSEEDATSSHAADATAAELEDVQMQHISSLIGLSTDVLHERAAFLPHRHGHAHSNAMGSSLTGQQAGTTASHMHHHHLGSSVISPAGGRLHGGSFALPSGASVMT